MFRNQLQIVYQYDLPVIIQRSEIIEAPQTPRPLLVTVFILALKRLEFWSRLPFWHMLYYTYFVTNETFFPFFSDIQTFYYFELISCLRSSVQTKIKIITKYWALCVKIFKTWCSISDRAYEGVLVFFSFMSAKNPPSEISHIFSELSIMYAVNHQECWPQECWQIPRVLNQYQILFRASEIENFIFFVLCFEN